jgi:hypothetical protein
MLCTDEFQQLGRHEAESLGMPALPIALVPHPLGGQKREHIQEKADKSLDQVVRILTTPASHLMQQALGNL